MVDVAQLLVRFLHVMSGVMWVGGISLWSMVIAPSVMRRAPPPIRGPFLVHVLPRLTRYLTISGAVTIVTGLWTMGLIYGWSNLSSVFKDTGAGIALGVGLGLGIAMFVVGLAIVQPTAGRLLGMMQKMPAAAAPQGPPPPELVTLGKRVAVWGMVNLLLGFAALGAMAFAASARGGL